MLEQPVPPRVLIVDDVEENLKVLTETLTEHGLYPLQAKDGNRAIQIAQKARPDLILLDIQMPGLDGFATIARLQADAQTRDIPVIFISALNDIEDKVRGFQAGAVDYVSKPFRREEVIARVGTHLRLRQALRQVESERSKARALLLNVIPLPVAEELTAKGVFAPQMYEDVSVLFADLVDFTAHAAALAPAHLIDELNELFTAFDEIMDRHRCERIKTVGDAYIAVGGMHEPARPRSADAADPTSHSIRMTDAALAMRRYLLERNARSAQRWQIRIGIHCGQVIGAIVGVKKYLFDIFGDTVNTASRLQTAGAPMRVNVSSTVAGRLSNRFVLSPREPLLVKGKGSMAMVFVDDNGLGGNA